MSGVLHSEHTTEVRVRFAPRVAKAAIAARVVAERDIQLSDGSVKFAYSVAESVTKLCAGLLAGVPKPKLPRPLSARDRLRMLVAEIAAKYNYRFQRTF